MFTFAKGQGHRLVSERTEGIALVLFTACSWGLTWPQSKFLLTTLPPFTMRATGRFLGCGFVFLEALVRRERIWRPTDQWPRLLLFSMLNYGLFIVLGTERLDYLRVRPKANHWNCIASVPSTGSRPA